MSGDKVDESLYQDVLGVNGMTNEDTPAYRVLQRANLLCTKYRLESADGIEAIPANSTPWINLCLNVACCPFRCCFTTFETPNGYVSLVEDGRGKFNFHQAGVHRIMDPFQRFIKTEAFGVNQIVHGDRNIVVIEQGYIGFALEKGQPVLLPPGMHQWQSSTMIYRGSYDLNNNVIQMGPLTLVTVDEGYAAVTEDNGRQEILDGGQTYLLNHRNWKFKKFVSCKIQTNAMQQIRATSADNVLMSVNATVIWRITDVRTAAKNAAETIQDSGTDRFKSVDDIRALSNDVLKQAEASLAAFIGAVNYSDQFNVAAVVQSQELPEFDETAASQAQPPPPAKAKTATLFDLEKLSSCVQHANKITNTYGVTIISINVVGAVPADATLQNSLAQGAVAAAEAIKFETVARGKKNATLIEAKGLAEAEVMRARGTGEAERIRAEGARAAADLLADSETAVRFAMVEKTGEALGDKSAFFFGAQPQSMEGLLAPAVVAAAAMQTQGGAPATPQAQSAGAGPARGTPGTGPGSTSAVNQVV
mmetsp:Transcript_25221/g.51314  ORF Transcript_25221/g.51314 Transcript_25221/m.51314 type:complete len:534 (-) Transcript_25221:235-1836(-)